MANNKAKPKDRPKKTGTGQAGARLEGLTRQYNNHIIISEFTYEKVKQVVQVNELGSVVPEQLGRHL